MTKQVTLKVFFLITALCGFIGLQAKESKLLDQGYAIDSNQILSSYNAPARYDVKKNIDIYLKGSFILWQAIEQGLDLGYTISNNPGNNPTRILHMNFDFKPGFKATLGSNVGLDDWIWQLNYTFLHRSQHSSRAKAAGDPFTLYTVHDMASVGALVNPLKLSSQWKLDFDILDLAFARPCYIGTKLTLSPFVGLKGGWIKQVSENAIYTSSNTKYKISETEKTWLLGPRAGVNGNWMIDEGFRFFSNFAASLFYQSFEIYAREFLTPLSTYIINANKYRRGYINPSFELGVGFGWGTYCWKDQMHLDLLGGYEFQFFANQNLMTTLEEELANMTAPSAGNLMMHGFTFALRLDF